MNIYDIKPYNFKFYSKDKLPLKDLVTIYKNSKVFINRYSLKTISKYNDTLVISKNEGMKINISTNDEYAVLICKEYYNVSFDDIFSNFICEEIFDLLMLKKNNFFYCFSRAEIDTYNINVFREFEHVDDETYEDSSPRIDYESVFADPSMLLGEYKEINLFKDEVIFEMDYLKDFRNAKELIENTKEKENNTENRSFLEKVKGFFTTKNLKKKGYIRFGLKDEGRFDCIETIINFDIKDSYSSARTISNLIMTLASSVADFIEIETDLDNKEKIFIYIIKNEKSFYFFFSTSVNHDSPSNIKFYDSFHTVLDKELSKNSIK